MNLHPLAGKPVALATRHRKERAIARPLRAAVGAEVVVPPELDTDALGTFSGERPRTGSPEETARAKARLGMAALGLPRGLASEGSFGPHPWIPGAAAGFERLLYVDDDFGFEVAENLITGATNHASLRVAAEAPATDFLARVGFPSHALVVAPESDAGGAAPTCIHKGITDPVELRRAILEARDASPTGAAVVFTDMRAHMNPTRMRVLRRLAFRLARRLRCCCPVCRCPGFGVVEHLPGLPCAACGEPTQAPLAEVHACAKCTHRETRPVPGPAEADPATCPLCNP